MVLDIDGNVLAKVNANDLLDNSGDSSPIPTLGFGGQSEDPLTENYMKFLKKGIEAGKRDNK
jgi:hypothetical protein